MSDFFTPSYQYGYCKSHSNSPNWTSASCSHPSYPCRCPPGDTLLRISAWSPRPSETPQVTNSPKLSSSPCNCAASRTAPPSSRSGTSSKLSHTPRPAYEKSPSPPKPARPNLGPWSGSGSPWYQSGNAPWSGSTSAPFVRSVWYGAVGWPWSTLAPPLSYSPIIWGIPSPAPLPSQWPTRIWCRRSARGQLLAPSSPYPWECRREDSCGCPKEDQPW